MLPLTGLRVVDFTHVLAGPACAYYLGLMGAEVIKVESLGKGDAMRHRGGTDTDAQARGMSTAYMTQGAGKKSVALDLASPDGAQTMRRLLKRADIFVENHLPRTMTDLGLDPDSVRAANPRIIHCALTGYGRGGPLENAPAYDVNIQAISGLMSVTGTSQTGPIRTGAPIVDYGVALSAGFAITAALHQRNQTGKGCFIDVSMLETAHLMMSSTVTDYLSTGNEPKRRGNAANSRSPGAGNFPCKDGILSLGVNEENQFMKLALVLGKEHWLSDPRFSNRSARKENAMVLETKLSEALLAKTADTWEQIMQENGVPAAKLRTLAESLDMPHVQDRGFVHRFPDGSGVPTLPFKFLSSPAFKPHSQAPSHGKDTDEVRKL
ncbi:MAG: CoA transferase, partial [Paracoccaceae bacterium]